MLTRVSPCPGPGAGRCKRQPQLAQHRAITVGHRLRDCRHLDGDILTGLRGRDAVLERTAYETWGVLTG